MSDTKQNGAAVTIEIFDPPMCCPGGLCGPAIDPALLDVNETVLKIKNRHGIVIRRHLLQQEGQKFMENPAVLALLKNGGTDVLPITVVNGEVVKKQGFPSYEELLQWSGIDAPASEVANEKQEE